MFMIPGGLHPIEIGNKLNNYEIKAIHSTIRTSPPCDSVFPSDGGFIVYLAKDINSRYVCLKILGATSSIDPSLQAEQELLDRILAGDDEGRREFIHAPTKRFWIEGVNGKH